MVVVATRDSTSSIAPSSSSASSSSLSASSSSSATVDEAATLELTTATTWIGGGATSTGLAGGTHAHKTAPNNQARRRSMRSSYHLFAENERLAFPHHASTLPGTRGAQVDQPLFGANTDHRERGGQRLADARAHHEHNLVLEPLWGKPRQPL